MKIHTLDSDIVVPRSLEETFRFFEDPTNLARITPESMGFRIVSHDFRMRKGLEIEYRVHIFGVPLPWKSLISEYNPPHLFVDEAVKSPYALWRHRHSFEQTRDGTHVRDHVDYALPLYPFGEAGHFIVKRQLRLIFSYRQRVLRQFLGTVS